MSQRPPANRMMLQQFKARSVGAIKGHSLLKKKRDALKSRFQMMLKEIVECKKSVGESMNTAAFALAKASWATESDISAAIISRVKKPSVTARLQSDNVAGVLLPVFQMAHDATLDTSVQTLGVASGGQVIQACRETHLDTIRMLIKMASLQTSFVTLDEEIKMTGRRVNALEYVVIPRILDIIAWIKQEMDEMEREEFYRVKKVVAKKRERIEAQRILDELEEKEANIKSERKNERRVLLTESCIPGRDEDLVV
eukprot:GEMP01047759.1.p1 GENE.GEMP01047759.1~~GEMP01047759.1.p1  ORF type:complete len:255 (+),score=78.08 GEMP01047759.1:172-936(+)